MRIEISEEKMIRAWLQIFQFGPEKFSGYVFRHMANKVACKKLNMKLAILVKDRILGRGLLKNTGCTDQIEIWYTRLSSLMSKMKKGIGHVWAISS